MMHVSTMMRFPQPDRGAGIGQSYHMRFGYYTFCKKRRKEKIDKSIFFDNVLQTLSDESVATDPKASQPNQSEL